MDTTASRGPLSHVRVLDLTRFYPGGYCTGLLADLGADVVKVEAPGAGDGLRFSESGPFPAAHISFNRGKRSLQLNLKSEGAPEVLRALARHADVVVESQRPGLLDSLGVGYDDLRRENPRLVWCSLTGFGSTGPYAEMPGHDLGFLGQSGMLSVMGEHRAEPPLSEAVMAVPFGGLTAAVGILAALAAREQTGEGSRLEASVTDAATWAIQDTVVRELSAPGQRWGAFAARRIYHCADGGMVTVTSSEPRSWRVLVEAVGRPDLADHVLGVDEEPVIAALVEAFATRPAEHWLQEPGLAGGVGPVNQPGDLLGDPDVVARKVIVALDDEAGTPVVANPIRFDGADGTAASFARRPPPELGADTDDVLAAAGFTADDIAALHADGVV
jgi:alpha-methylacyl-CoA racemase